MNGHEEGNDCIKNAFGRALPDAGATVVSRSFEKQSCRSYNRVFDIVRFRHNFNNQCLKRLLLMELGC